TVDVWLIHRQQEPIGEPESADGPHAAEEQYELETAELEARMVAMHIREMMGQAGKPPFQVTEDRAGTFRPLQYRDLVILWRATQPAAPIYVEQLRAAGIPAYAELSSGYFEAVEVDVMLSLLKVIDNPLQDIPLAGVLRSPIVGLSAEQLAQIRLAAPSGPFYEAMLAFLERAPERGEGDGDDAERARRAVAEFVGRLREWRNEAARGALSELIWRIYRETGFYDYMGGLPGGAGRQANLMALYDRARQFESTSFRGLFRFLRFIERMKDSGSDLGAAGTGGGRDDAVRIMSIHKSKGLEFPVVIVAGLGKTFNERDLNGDFLLHR